MARIDSVIERLVEPDAVKVFRDALSQKREAWRARYIPSFRQHTRPRWPLLKLRRHFLRLGIPCQHCGLWYRLEVSHKVAHADGGLDTLGNVEWLCHTCHLVYASPAFVTRSVTL